MSKKKIKELAEEIDVSTTAISKKVTEKKKEKLVCDSVFYQKQLLTKDNQIDMLQNLLKEQQNLLDQQQRLTIQTN